MKTKPRRGSRPAYPGSHARNQQLSRKGDPPKNRRVRVVDDPTWDPYSIKVGGTDADSDV